MRSYTTHSLTHTQLIHTQRIHAQFVPILTHNSPHTYIHVHTHTHTSTDIPNSMSISLLPDLSRLHFNFSCSFGRRWHVGFSGPLILFFWMFVASLIQASLWNGFCFKVLCLSVISMFCIMDVSDMMYPKVYQSEWTWLCSKLMLPDVFQSDPSTRTSGMLPCFVKDLHAKGYAFSVFGEAVCRSVTMRLVLCQTVWFQVTLSVFLPSGRRKKIISLKNEITC